MNNNMYYCSFVSIHYIICECGETFPTEDDLKEHLEHDHVDGPMLDPKFEYKCDTCNKVYTTERACLVHQRVHMSPKLKSLEDQENRKKYYAKKIVCEVCGKRYASNAALKYHQRVHTGERPYQCSECPKTFTMPLFLQIHLRTHTGERPYECPHCPKAFSNKAALLRHNRVHTGIKPYECPQCGKFFTQSNSMKLHVKTVHMKLPAPYKSKNRRAKQALKLQQQQNQLPDDVIMPEGPMNVEVEIQEGVYASGVKMEMCEYETEEAEIYHQGDVYEVYEDGDIFYDDIKVEGSEIAMYEGEEPEVLYEEVYEVQHGQ